MRDKLTCAVGFRVHWINSGHNWEAWWWTKLRLNHPRRTMRWITELFEVYDLNIMSHLARVCACSSCIGSRFETWENKRKSERSTPTRLRDHHKFYAVCFFIALENRETCSNNFSSIKSFLHTTCFLLLIERSCFCSHLPVLFSHTEPHHNTTQGSYITCRLKLDYQPQNYLLNIAAVETLNSWSV